VVHAICEGTGAGAIALALLGYAFAEERVFKFSAGRTEVRMEKGKWVKVYEDGFRATDGTLALSAQRGIYREAAREIVLEGDVVLRDTSGLLEAEEVVYDLKDDVARAFEVRASYRGWEMRAGRAEYFRKKGCVAADGGVVLKDTAGKAEVEALRGWYEFEGRGYVEGSARLVRKVGEDEVSIYAARIFLDQDKVVAEDSVRIRRGNIDAKCGRVEYWESGMVLLGKPQVCIEDSAAHTTLKGDTIEVALEDLVPQHLRLSGNAEVTSVGREGESILVGSKIWVFLHGDEPERVLVEWNAVSVYRHRGKEPSLNTVTGDRMEVSLEGGKAVRVKVDGGVEGTYRWRGKP